MRGEGLIDLPGPHSGALYLRFAVLGELYLFSCGVLKNFCELVMLFAAMTP